MTERGDEKFEVQLKAVAALFNDTVKQARAAGIEVRVGPNESRDGLLYYRAWRDLGGVGGQ